jgi:hypothetical protein
VVSKNPLLKLLAIVFIVISTGTILNGNEPGSTSILTKNRNLRVSRSPSSPSVKQSASTQAISTLVNGNYQFCSEPPPSDWRSGAGVCFNFTKIGDRVSGYYGYPHTDDFICVRGKIKDNLVTGEALMVSWLGREWTSIPKTAIKWDKEGRLTIKDSKIIRTTIDKSGRTDWILFGSAKLDPKGFYQSNKSLLTSPSQLCDWKGTSVMRAAEKVNFKFIPRLSNVSQFMAAIVYQTIHGEVSGTVPVKSTVTNIRPAL